MSRQVTYSYARQNLAEILSAAEDAQEPVIIFRRGHEDVAVIPASELRESLRGEAGYCGTHGPSPERRPSCS